METYVSKLMSSSLPVPAWTLVIIWLALFTFSLFLSRMGNKLANGQNYIVTGRTGELVREQNWKLTIFQILFSSLVFIFSVSVGGACFVFFTGGWIVITAVSIPLNLRSILYLRALSRSGAATGSVNLSNRLAVKDAAFKLLGMATFCLVLGLVLANLALLGGAFFLSATAIGYLRKSEKKVSNEQSA